MSFVGLLFLVSLFLLVGLIIAWLASRNGSDDSLHGNGSLYVLGIGVSSVFSFWFGTWLLFPFLYGSEQEAGPAGDMFGGLTSLFSGLAFAGLIATLHMQRQELWLQRAELTDTRREFARQRFESTLFSILDLFVSHINNLSYDEGSGIKNGRAVLEYYASELSDEIYVSGDPLDRKSEMQIKKRFYSLEEQIKEYEVVYSIDFEADLGPYFRLLYNAIRHIEKSDLEHEEKLKYSKIVRAHLSSAEVKLLFFNCLSELGRDFKPWVEVHSLLKHVGPKVQHDNPAITNAYDPKAFGN